MTTKSPTSNTAPATGFVSANTLAVMLEVSVTQVWRMAKNGSLPKPIKLGPATTRWRIEEVNEALAKLAA